MQTTRAHLRNHSIGSLHDRCRSQAGRPSAVAAVPIIRSQRCHCRSQLRAAEARQPSFDAVIIDLDAVVQGLEVVSTAWAFAAATATAGDIAGTPGVYTRYMQQLLPVLQQPHEAALMLRLLHEEGIVGARSTAGREGPVVGRPVRHSGSRPLLLNEILEHWVDEIKPTCLLRWSRQAGCSCSQLEQQVREAYAQAQQTIQWDVLDVQQQCHGSSSSSSSNSQTFLRAAAAPAVAAAAGATSSSNMSAASSAQTATATASKPVQPANGSSSSSSSSNSSSSSSSSSSSAGVVSITVQPYVSVVPCLQHCLAQVYIASTYPADISQAALAAVQLPCNKHWEGHQRQQQQQQQQVGLICGSSISHCLQQLQLQDRGSSSSSSAAAQSQVVVVISSPSKASLTAQTLQQEPFVQQQQQQQRPANLLTLQEPLQVAEWACKAPSLRVRALSGRGLGLLSECGLAEMLGADSSDAVMGGIAWR